MDQRAYDAAQQGLIASLIGTEHEANLQRFIQGLRKAPEWTEEQVEEVEQKIRILLGMVRQEQLAAEKEHHMPAPWRVVGGD